MKYKKPRATCATRIFSAESYLLSVSSCLLKYKIEGIIVSNTTDVNRENLQNINQDKIDILQTDDTMVDFYNIDNDIDKINLSKKRNKMINECMKIRYKK